MSGVTPPQPIADFPDHPYIRNEDIIRPKPRRLVDMRRSAIGGDSSGGPQFSAPVSGKSFEGILNGGMMSSSPNPFTNQLPPILPAKPFYPAGSGLMGHLTESPIGKPLPPRPSSNSNQNNLVKPLAANQLQRPVPQSPIYTQMSQHPQQKQSQPFLKSLALSQRSAPNLPQLLQPLNSTNNMYTPTPTPVKNRCVLSKTPNPPYSVYQNNQSSSSSNSPQKRLFLSPQPNDKVGHRDVNPTSNFGGSSGNLLSEDEVNDNVPYYSELTLSPPKSSPGFMPAHVSSPVGAGQLQTQKPRVRVEWKSVDNVQKHNGPKLLTTEIDVGPSPPTTATTNVYGGNKISHPPMSTVPIPDKSPEYDRIKSPSEIAMEMKERLTHGVLYVEPNPPSTNAPMNGMNKVNHVNSSFSNCGNSNNSNSSGCVTELNNTLNTTLNQLVKTGTESTDCSSLGRSSTSDGDFGTLGGNLSSGGDSTLYTANAGSTPSAKSKLRHPTPTSKLKSRRKNILHNLNSDEMHLLNSGPQRFVNSTNTGTGGSSSDGSSGHASMSDSQTSGSPPAEYASVSGAAEVNCLSTGKESGPSSASAGYKAVLKSVPEDESSVSNSLASGPAPKVAVGSEKGSEKKCEPSVGSSVGRKSSRSRHRNKESVLLGNGNSGLEDIKQAIEQLTLRSCHGSVMGGGHQARETGHHSSYSTSTYSSMSGSECDRHRRSHVLRYSSLDTINTQVTSADEFVWVDSHSRLVELQHIPWSNHDILRVVEKSSKLKENLERISMETVPRVSYLLQRALVRVARETQRLARPYGFCSKHEVSSALRIVLAPALADTSSKACLRAAAMFSVSTSDPLHKDSKSSRAGLNLHVGRFHRWMIDVRLGRFVHEFAAIHMAAAMENLVEEILGQALSYITMNCESGSSSGAGSPILTAALLEQAISNNGDLWGLLQPYAHLNAGRTASGALALPRRWASAASVDSSGSSSTTIGPSPQDDASIRSHNHNKSLEQSLLTTCVGSIVELADILSRVSHYHYKQLPLTSNTNGSKAVAPAWAPSATDTLFYFMRCSQLETAEDHLGSSGNLGASTATLGNDSDQRSTSQHHGPGQAIRAAIQELVYERPFIVLPPLIEWVRVAAAHADHRHSTVVDKDDVMQAARLLLPGIDCPVRLLGSDEFTWPRRPLDEFECNRRLKVDLAFKMLTSGRSDLVAQALLLMPPSKANTFNESGLSPLILASLRGEENMVRVLLDAGADTDMETPPNNPTFHQANAEVQHWTAVTFSSLMGHTAIVKTLLEKNARVEGGAKLSEERSTQTPLQVAAASGHMEIVSLLLNHGANPFMSTLVRDSLCYTGSAQRGSFSAISVAASHGQRAVLHKLLSFPFSQPSSKEVLSLEEILAEGAQSAGNRSSHNSNNGSSRPEDQKMLSKSQIKVLQEAMYQSAENGHLEITLDLRNMGIPWTLHCWVNALSTAYELRCEPVIDQLLQDFLQILPNEDFTQTSFIEDCLPLLFTIFRNSKIEGTTLLLADIFQTCFGRDSIKEIRDNSISNGTRIDPKYVNNPELSDVQFRVEGRVFYAHKIVLVTSSPRFKSMLKSAPESNPPILQINDIRYPVFQMVMEYLYNGGSDCIRHIEAEDVLELMAAANFFQLDGLLRFCEAKCSQSVNIESIVTMYIHAKVYNAVQLLEYCQSFLLQNMVALLTFDDSVRRLIFGKKLHNHDVLAGLLITLQARLKSRPTRKQK